MLWLISFHIGGECIEISTRNGSTKSLDVAEAPVRPERVVFRLNPANGRAAVLSWPAGNLCTVTNLQCRRMCRAQLNGRIYCTGTRCRSETVAWHIFWETAEILDGGNSLMLAAGGRSVA